ncbi:methyl-accepting chemotaxis protein [Sulfitobacter geojensis]|jgi:PAS domain S-box-containing protein|uniref:methyl-accepting chemotaxis protein n=1 Tax=Sulfitobacter geojensis TaxID=1342299 RepID=UPI0031EBA52D
MSDVLDSLFSNIEAFGYRCLHDSDHTLQVIEGGVKELLGYDAADLIGNRLHAFGDLAHPEDKQRLFEAVDLAVERRGPWDLAYRLLHEDGSYVWVRERGAAVFEKGTLTHLQGLIVSATEEMSLRTELETILQQSRESNSEIIGLTGKITGSIRQLTMLSINARIEAARSGDAGRGFAVVAEEMKKLADQNAEWAYVISEKVSHVQKHGQ